MVNIIVPVYKARDTLPLLIKSLEAQTKNMFMVTLVQDCDGENYSDIINESHLNITLLHTEKNSGPGAARNVGLRNTTCQYVMFVDSDDMLLPRAVEILSREISLRNADIIKSDILMEKPYGIGSVILDADNEVWTHGNIYNVSFLKEKNIWFPEAYANEDVAFNILANKLADKRLHINETTYIWRFNKNSLTRKSNTNFYVGYHKMIYEAILRVLNERENAFTEEEIANWLSGMYGIAQATEYYGHEYNKEYTIKFLNLPQVKKIYTTKHGLDYLINKTRQGSDNANGGKIIFYKKTFSQWLYELIGYELKEI